MNDFDRHHTHAWLILITVSLSAMSVLSHSIGMISLLLPRMMSEFAIDVQSAQWVLTSFMLTRVVIMPAVGWIGDVFGQRNLCSTTSTRRSAGQSSANRRTMLGVSSQERSSTTMISRVPSYR